MKHRLSYTLGLIFLGMGGIASNPASAATTAAGPYYANPSWDQQLPASTRFVVLSNWVDAAHPSGGAAVLDRETGLVWEQSPTAPPADPKFDWEEAQLHCVNLNTGGRTGWRLPTVQELMSLMDLSVSPGPKLPRGHPFSNVQSAVYWSATTYAVSASTGWDVFFDAGGTGLVGKDIPLLAWCVRGGQGVDPQ